MPSYPATFATDGATSGGYVAHAIIGGFEWRRKSVSVDADAAASAAVDLSPRLDAVETSLVELGNRQYSGEQASCEWSRVPWQPDNAHRRVERERGDSEWEREPGRGSRVPALHRGCLRRRAPLVMLAGHQAIRSNARRPSISPGSALSASDWSVLP